MARSYNEEEDATGEHPHEAPVVDGISTARIEVGRVAALVHRGPVARMFREDRVGTGILLEIGDDHAIVRDEALGACRELGQEMLRVEHLLHRAAKRRDAGEQIGEGRFSWLRDRHHVLRALSTPDDGSKWPSRSMVTVAASSLPDGSLGVCARRLTTLAEVPEPHRSVGRIVRYRSYRITRPSASNDTPASVGYTPPRALTNLLSLG